MKEVKETIVSIMRSLFTFPSCVFWVCCLVPLIGFIFGATLVLVDGNFRYGYVPTISTILLTKHRFSIYFSHCFKIIAFIRIIFMIQRYYKRVLHNGAPAAKLLIKKYLKKELFFSIILIISHVSFLFLDIVNYTELHTVSIFVYCVANYFFNYYLTLLNRIKNGEMYPIGCGIDAAILFLAIVDIPLYYREFNAGRFMSYNYTMAAVLQLVTALLIDVKFLFIGLLILGFKFIRFPSDSLP